MTTSPAAHLGDEATEAADIPTRPETRGIELIEGSARHGRPRELFAVWAAPNVSVLNFTIGATMILLGMEIWQAVLVVIVSSLLWIFPGIVAISGPSAGTSGAVITRAIYGIRGNKVMVAFTGWLISAVYLSLNWLASSFMGADLLAQYGLGDPTLALILVTLVVSAVTVLVAVYGHALILRSYSIVTIVLLAIFIVATVFIAPHIDFGFRQAAPLEGVALASAMTIGFTITAATPLSYSNSADLARYLPRSTPPWRIIAATALGGALPCIVFTVLGVLLATGVEATAMDAGIEGVILGMLPAWFVPVFVLGVIVNTVALNGMTTYTSSMALQAIGIPIRRIPAAIIVGLIGTALTVYLMLSTSLLGAVNLMLQFLIIVVGPFMAVFVTDIVLRRNRYDGFQLFDTERGGAFWYAGGFNPAGLGAVVLGGIATALCLSTDVWSGPISVALGYVDLSIPAGMIVASAAYTVLGRRAIRAQSA